MFYLLRLILFTNLSLFFRTSSSNIPLYFLEFAPYRRICRIKLETLILFPVRCIRQIFRMVSVRVKTFARFNCIQNNRRAFVNKRNVKVPNAASLWNLRTSILQTDEFWTKTLH